MSEDDEEELLRLVESTQLMEVGGEFAIYVNERRPNGDSFTVVPIYHGLDGVAILEIWIEWGGTHMRFALIDEVEEHVEAVGKWVANGRMLVAFKDEVIGLPLPPDVKPMKLFARIAGPDQHPID